jgi:DNA-binding response OmpR family regulator
MLQELGAFKVMLKPVSPEELGKLLETVARRAEASTAHPDSSSG